MSTWEYRAVRVVNGSGEGCDLIRLAEVYYADDGTTIDGWAWASAPQGESREDLRAEVQHMLDAASKPIIPAGTLPGRESTTKEEGT